MARYDLVIKGGLVIDTAQDLFCAPLDIGVRQGKIAAIAAGIQEDADQVIQAQGAYVTPGLVDLHTHVYRGVCQLAVDPDPVALKTGVTTMIDCGTAGAATFDGLRRYVVNKSVCRILAAVNISTIGLADMPECGFAPYVDSNKALKCIQDNRDIAVAVKIRASRNALGDHGTIQPLLMAIEAAEAAGVPVIAHLGEPPPDYEQILEALRPGDILTHCFRKGPMHCPIDRLGLVKPVVIKARERGVKFDVGHGMGSYSWRTARLMIEQGFLPDILSTDLHTGSITTPINISMPDVMTKMLHLGLDLRTVVAAATVNPACSIGWSDRIGSLKPGLAADITILSLKKGSFQLSDSHHVLETVSQKLAAVWTIIAGKAYCCADL